MRTQLSELQRDHIRKFLGRLLPKNHVCLIGMDSDFSTIRSVLERELDPEMCEKVLAALEMGEDDEGEEKDDGDLVNPDPDVGDDEEDHADDPTDTSMAKGAGEENGYDDYDPHKGLRRAAEQMGHGFMTAAGHVGDVSPVFEDVCRAVTVGPRFAGDDAELVARRNKFQHFPAAPVTATAAAHNPRNPRYASDSRYPDYRRKVRRNGIAMDAQISATGETCNNPNLNRIKVIL